MHEARTKGSWELRQQMKERTAAAVPLRVRPRLLSRLVPDPRCASAPQEEAVLFQFGRPLAHKAREASARQVKESLASDVVLLQIWQLLDFHRYIMVNFDTAAAADIFAKHAKAARLVCHYEIGGSALDINVIRRKRLPPHIERRGRTLRAVYDALTTKFTSGEELRQNHEQKATEPCTKVLARHSAEDELRPFATIGWKDDRTVVRHRLP